VWLGLVYLPIGAIYVYPAVKLWAYSSAIARLSTSRATGDLEAALDQQRAFWKYCGVAMVAMIALYGVVFLGAMVFSVARRH
jgi:cation transporter-like permease